MSARRGTENQNEIKNNVIIILTTREKKENKPKILATKFFLNKHSILLGFDTSYVRKYSYVYHKIHILCIFPVRRNAFICINSRKAFNLYIINKFIQTHTYTNQSHWADLVKQHKYKCSFYINKNSEGKKSIQKSNL